MAGERTNRQDVPNTGPDPTRTSPSNPRPQRIQLKRSISEVGSSLRIRHARDEKSTPSAAGALPARSSVDVSRLYQGQGLTAASVTATSSRRTSMAAIHCDQLPSMPPNLNPSQTLNPNQVPKPTPPPPPPPPPPSSGDWETGEGVEKVEGLKKSLAELGTSSIMTTRRLDDTYYSVLERLSMLQSTVFAIKEVAVRSKQIDRTFRAESNEVVAHANSQLQPFGNFERQQRRIRALEDRILHGRDKIKNLSQRVDVVGDRIDGWERADKEWQERTRRRLKIIWILVIGLMTALVLLYLFLRPGDMVYGHPGADGLLGVNGTARANGTVVNFKRSSNHNGDEDDILRGFDEL